MTVTATVAIPEALLTHLESFTYAEAFGIAWPNLAFTPTPGTPYLDVALLPNETGTPMVGSGASKEHIGFLQIAVMWPAGEGAMSALALAGAIIEHFKKGTRITTADISFAIEREPWIAPPLPEPDRLRVPVSIPYRVFQA